MKGYLLDHKAGIVPVTSKSKNSTSTAYREAVLFNYVLSGGSAI
jgi:hypothetical protein